jgi:hypothetical protein
MLCEVTNTGNYSVVAPRELTDDDLSFIQQYTQNTYDNEQLKKHILAVHEEIRKSCHVYRCISAFLYLFPKSRLHPEYRNCVELLRYSSSSKLLDTGTCFGQEIRCFLADGVLPSQLYATDVTSTYWEAGKRLYLDNDVPSLRKFNEVSAFFGD